MSGWRGFTCVYAGLLSALEAGGWWVVFRASCFFCYFLFLGGSLIFFEGKRNVGRVRVVWAGAVVWAGRRFGVGWTWRVFLRLSDVW